MLVSAQMKIGENANEHWSSLISFIIIYYQAVTSYYHFIFCIVDHAGYHNNASDDVLDDDAADDDDLANCDDYSVTSQFHIIQPVVV